MATMERNWIAERRLPPFPEDFGRRLERLKELSGLSWTEFAETLGVTDRGVLKWRRGGPPSGACFWAILKLARDLSGGYDLVLDNDEDEGWKGGREHE